MLDGPQAVPCEPLMFYARQIMPTDNQIMTADSTSVPLWVLSWEGWISKVRSRAPPRIANRTQQALQRFFEHWEGEEEVSGASLGHLNSVLMMKDWVDKYCPEAFPNERRVAVRRNAIKTENLMSSLDDMVEL